MTELGILNSDVEWTGRLHITDLISVALPAHDEARDFQETDLCLDPSMRNSKAPAFFLATNTGFTKAFGTLF